MTNVTENMKPLGKLTTLSYDFTSEGERMLDDSGKADGIERPARIEVYKIYKGYLEHENLLLNQRVTWLVTIQSFMLAAYAIPIAKPELISAGAENAFREFIAAYLIAICILAILICRASAASISAAIRAQADIESKWTAEHLTDARALGLPNIAGGGNVNAGRKGGTFARRIPYLMICFWLTNIALISWKLIEWGKVTANLQALVPGH